MTPDELILIIVERLQGTDTRWKVENYAATRASAERLLRTMSIIPDEPPKALPPSNDATAIYPLVTGTTPPYYPPGVRSRGKDNPWR